MAFAASLNGRRRASEQLTAWDIAGAHSEFDLTESEIARLSDMVARRTGHDAAPAGEPGRRRGIRHDPGHRTARWRPPLVSTNRMPRDS